MATLPDLLAAAQQNLTAAAQAATAQQAQLDQARAQHDTDTATIADLRAQLAAVKIPPPKVPPTPPGWQVAFFDGFDGPLDPNLWTVVDQQAYARDQAWLSKDQVTVKDSLLTITAANRPPLNTPTGMRSVVSGAVLPGPNAVRLRTPTGTVRWEICAACPTAAALWFAGWLRNAGVGELDIFEGVGKASPIVQTAHQTTSGKLADGSKADHLGYDWVPPVGWDRSAFHVYALEWDAGTGNVRWYVDGQLTRPVNPSSIAYPSGKPATWLTGAAYADPMALLLNLQVGGGFSTYYGNQVVNPAELDGTPRCQLRVDWVRYLTKPGAS